MISKKYADIAKVIDNNRTDLRSNSKIKQMGVGYKIKNGMMTDTVGIVLYVTSKPSNDKLRTMQIDPVPKELDGIPTDVIEIPGGFKLRMAGAMEMPRGLRRGGPDDARHRPFSGGVAMIHSRVPATGTLGIVVNKTTDATKLYGLTNNHVGANEDVEGMSPAAAKKGDLWIQPGAHGGGRVPNDTFAKLDSWNRMKPSSPGSINYYDASIGEIVDKSMRDITPYEITEIGKVKGTEDIEIGDRVIKRGRTTLKTSGIVQAVAVSSTVEYNGFPCDFEDQVTIVGDPIDIPFSQGGDSGSLVVSDSKDRSTRAYKAKALLFAGGQTSDNIDITIASPIKRIVDDFELKI